MAWDGDERRMWGEQIIDLTEKISAITPEIKMLGDRIDSLKTKLDVHKSINFCDNCQPTYWLKWVALAMTLLAVSIFLGPREVYSFAEKILVKWFL